MNNKNYISEEAFEELVNGLDFIGSFTLYGRKSLKYHIKRLQEENQQLKKQLEELEEQNFNLREDIMLKKMAFPHEKIKDKSLYDLYDMPGYSDLAKENQELKNQLERAKSKLTTMFANGHDDKVLDDLLELCKILEVE